MGIRVCWVLESLGIRVTGFRVVGISVVGNSVAGY